MGKHLFVRVCGIFTPSSRKLSGRGVSKPEAFYLCLRLLFGPTVFLPPLTPPTSSGRMTYGDYYCFWKTFPLFFLNVQTKEYSTVSKVSPICRGRMTYGDYYCFWKTFPLFF